MNQQFSFGKIRLVVAGVVMAFLFAAEAALTQEIPAAIKEQIRKLEAAKQALSPEEKKLNSQLYDVLQKMKAAGITRANARLRNVKETFSTPLINGDSNGRFEVTLRTTAITPSLLTQLAALEFEIKATTEKLPITPNLHMISGWAFFDRIKDIAKLAPIFHIRPTDKPIFLKGSVTSAGDGILRADQIRTTFLTGSVTSAGDGILRADQVRTAFGVDGTCQKVGIISNGAEHLANSQMSGDLPASVQIISNSLVGLPGNQDEGTAMLEIVHDLAPGAALAFADAGTSEMDFANNIKLLSDAKCTVISDDVLSPFEPVYEDGMIAQTIDNVVKTNNIVYISSAGNEQVNHYESTFRDFRGGGFHGFNYTTYPNESMQILLPARASILLVLQWNNRFGRSADDYDLFLLDVGAPFILQESIETQDGNDDPREAIYYTNPFSAPKMVQVSVKRYSGAVRDFSLYAFSDSDISQQYVNREGAIYGHAAATNCLAVGAINARDPGNDTLEPFSSQGPSRIYSYDARGNPVSFVDRRKPDHVAIDGVQTKVGQLGFFGNPFFGTSAATAHTAAVAALVRSANPALPAFNVGVLPLTVGTVLSATAVDLGARGFDNAFGSGRIDAFAAVQAVFKPGTLSNVSAAAYTTPVAPNSIVVGFGTDFAIVPVSVTDLPLPTSLSGATVKVTDSGGVTREAPIFFVSPTQVNYIMPPETALGNATVIVTNFKCKRSLQREVRVEKVAPGLFTQNSLGTGVPAGNVLRVKADNSQVYETINTEIDIRNGRVYLILYGTGIRGAKSVICKIGYTKSDGQSGEVEVPVEYFGKQGGNEGLDQINVFLPGSLASLPKSPQVDVKLFADGKPANVVQVRIKLASSNVSAKSAAEEVEEVSAAAIPDEIVLQQNYPNPFNPSTEISYSVPKATHVTLKIYNLTGQEVATLVDEVRERGNYTVTFDASRLASGMYLSVLKAGEVRLVRRLAFMK